MRRGTGGQIAPRAGATNSAAAAGVHAASLLLAAVLILWLVRHTWFFFDDWEFITNRIVPGDLHLFRPHMEHWSTVPILVYRAVYAVFALHSYLPYVAVLVALHLAAVHLEWRVLRRSGLDPWLSAALPLVLLFLGTSPENFLWAFQISYVGSVVFGLLHAMLADHDGPFGWRDAGGWAAGLIALMCSGVGLTMLAVAALVALMRRGLRGVVVTAALPFAAYLLWFLLEGRRGVSSHEITFDGLLGLPGYVWHALTTTVDLSTGLAGAGAVLLLGLGVWLVLRADLARNAAIPFAAAIGSLVFFTLVGAVRIRFGPDIGLRYVYPAVALLLPATGLALNALIGRHALRRVAVVGLIGVAAVNGAGVLRTNAHVWTDRDVISEQRILAAADLMRSGATIIGNDPDPDAAPDLTVAKLQRLIDQGALPTGVSITADARVHAVAQLQVAGGTNVHPGTAPATVVIRSVNDAQVVSRSAPGCVDVTPSGPRPRLVLSYDRPGEIMVTLTTSDGLHLDVMSAAISAQSSAQLAFPTAPGAALPVDVSTANASLGLNLPLEGRDTICAGGISLPS